MSGWVYFVSMSALTYFDPVTGVGVPLSGGTPLGLHVYECGRMDLGTAWNYCEVCSPFWRAYFNLSEGAAVRVAGKRHELGPQVLILLPEEVRFDCIAREGVAHFWVHFSVTGAWPSVTGAVTVSLSSAEQALWTELSEETTDAVAGDAHRLRNQCAGLLLMALGKAVNADASSTSPELQAWLTWVERSLNQALDIPSMAKQAGMGSRAFLNWFKGETGTTPMAYLKGRRVREACRKLRFTTASIERIAEETGFSNRYHFSRVFREKTGRTPADYRRRG